ncbi:MAG TPA: sulfatase [Rubrobacter sp.]|nr:sulfatase [Rubrobacter sp.]
MRNRPLTRKEFLKLAGAGVAGGALLGASGLATGCASKADGMNVVLVIMDSVRKDHVGAYGNDWIRTPNLDAVARDSLRFSRPYPESIPTLCARRAIHTGQRSWPFENWQPAKGDPIGLWGWQPIPMEQATLAEILKSNGYGTYFVTDTMHQFKSSMNFHRGFDVFDFFRGQTTDNYKPIWTAPEEEVSQALMDGNPSGMSFHMRQYFANAAGRKTEADWYSPMVFSQATDYLELLKDGGPFFLTVDCYDPHEPWDPPEKYVKMYDDEPYDLKEPFAVVYGSRDYLSDRELERMKARYSGELTMMDRWLGRFLDKMEELNLFENTLLILLSDHGVAFGEHDIVGKLPIAVYPELTDIIFLMRHPEGKGSGKTSDYYASTHDVAPTILGSLGIEVPEQMEGQNLLGLVDGRQPAPRSHFTLGYHDHAWCRDDDFAMFCRHDGTEAKLFDLNNDPKMDLDIAGLRPNLVRQMFEEYVIKDAGGPLPSY